MGAGETCRDLVEDREWLKQLAFPAAEKPGDDERGREGRARVRRGGVGPALRREGDRRGVGAGGGNGAGGRPQGAAAREPEPRRRRAAGAAHLAAPGHHAEGGGGAGRHGGGGRAHLRDRGDEDGERDHRARARGPSRSSASRRAARWPPATPSRSSSTAAVPAAVVVGAGAFGASLADRLAGEGWEVTLVDRFGPGDPRAESGGETRLLRCSHGARRARHAARAARPRAAGASSAGVLVVRGAGLAARRDGRLGGGQRARAARRGRAGRAARRRRRRRACARASRRRARARPATSPRPACCARRDGVRPCAERASRGRPAGDAARRGPTAPRCAWPSGGSRPTPGLGLGAWLAGAPPRAGARCGSRSSRSCSSRPARAPRRSGLGRLRPPVVGHGAVEPHGVKVASRPRRPPMDPARRPGRGRSTGRRPAPRASTSRCASRPWPDAPLAPRARLPLQPHRGLELPVRPRTPSIAGVWLLGGGSGHGFKHGPRDRPSTCARLLGGRSRAASRGSPLGERRSRRQPAHRRLPELPSDAPTVAVQTPSRSRRLLPLVLATTATQASIVVLAPLVVEIGRDLDASVSAVGLARSVLAATAVGVSLAIGPLIDRVGRAAADRARRRCSRSRAPGSPRRRPRPSSTRRSGHGRGRRVPALGRVRGRAASFADERGAVGDGLGGGRPVARLDRGQPGDRPARRAGSWRLAYAVPAVIASPRWRRLLAPRGRTDRRAGAARRGPVRRLPRPLRAALGDSRAGGLLRLDRRAHLRRSLLHREYGVGEARWACCWRSARWCSCRLDATPPARTTAPRRPLIVLGALGMGIMLIPVLNVTPSVVFTLGLFCVLAMFAAVRSTGSSALGPGAASRAARAA